MKIVIVIEAIEAWRGGAETSTVQFVEALDAAGHEVHLATRKPRTPIEGLPATIHALDAGLQVSKRRTIAFCRQAAAFTSSNKFDIVHAVTPCMTADIYQPRGGFVRESVDRNLALIRSPWFRYAKALGNHFNRKQQGMLQLERRLLSRTPPPFIAGVSAYVVRQAQEHFGVPAELARVVFNGVTITEPTDAQRCADADEVRGHYDIPRSELLALCVAHNFKLKGIRHWIEAARVLSTEHNVSTRTLIVGHDNTGPIRRLAQQLAMADRIQFVGSTKHVQKFMHAADVLVHPTYYDPCSRVVLEALTLGLPCVTTRYNGAAEIMTDGQDGYIIDSPDNIRALVEAVRKLADPDHHRTIGENGRKHRPFLDMNRHAREMIQLYEDAYARKCSP